MAASFTPLQPTLDSVHGDAAARPWITIPWSSKRTVIVLTLLPEAVWNSVVSVATEVRHVFTRFSTPVLWACVAYHFTAEPLLLLDVSHFTITALRVDWGSSAGQKFDKLTCWKGGILWQKVTELFSRAIQLPMFVYGDCMAACSILYTCQQLVWPNPRIWRGVHILLYV